VSYRCPVRDCDRTFASKQAVNGHQASHKKANLFSLADVKQQTREWARGQIRARLTVLCVEGKFDLTSFDRAMNVVDEVLK